MARILTWNGIPSTNITGLVIGPYRKSLVGKPRGVHQEVAGLAGSHFWAEQPGNSKFTAEAHVIADTIAERDGKVQEVADWYGYGGQAQLIVSDRPNIYWLATITDQADPEEWRELAQFELAWIISPFSYDATPSTEQLTPAGGSGSGSFVISDTEEAFPVYEITAVGGTIDSFDLTVEGLALTYQDPQIAAGNTVTVNTLSDTVTTGTSGDTMLTGAYNEGNLVMGFVTSGPFPILQPGTNNWSFGWTGSATSVTIDITWRRRYS